MEIKYKKGIKIKNIIINSKNKNKSITEKNRIKTKHENTMKYVNFIKL